MKHMAREQTTGSGSHSVGIRALKQNASGVVARASRGESITVTDRGREVARIVPLTSSPVEQLTREGRVRAAEGDLRELLDQVPAATGPALSDILHAMRADELR